MRQFSPRRIVCLIEETVETLYLLDEQRIAALTDGLDAIVAALWPQ